MNFRHNSWDLTFREPFGAMPTGSQVTLRVYTTNTENVKLRTYYRSNERFFDMVPSDKPDMLEYTLTLPKTPDLLWYDFRFETGGTTYCYGTQNDSLGGQGQIYEGYPPSYQITLYDAHRKTPEWYTGGIMYQIFPDRFNRGEKKTFDPAYPKRALIHGHWEDTPHYFRDRDGNIDYWDFFGGNLQGIIEKLDYLKSLNVSIIYLNPIFESQSNHKYDTANYLKISPDFGDEKLFKQLCTAAKERGINVILDGVFSHTGEDSIYFNKYGNYPELGAYQSKNSPYYGWYRFSNYPDDYESWWGVKSMPNVEEMTPTYQDYIFRDENSVIRHWLKTGASGWRLDVADELPDDFIVGIKEAMTREKKDAVLIGEVWEDASRKIAYGILRQYFSGRELDAVMNYPFREAFIDFFMGHRSSRETARLMMSLYENYPRQQFMGNMNLIGSHDRMRILTVFGDVPNLNKEADKEVYRMSENQYTLAKQRLKLFSLLQMSFPGVPCIYYGDEAGVEGYEDPFNRATYPWGREDPELIAWYKKITKIRAESEILQKGQWFPLPSEDDLFVFVRRYKNNAILCLFNRSTYAHYSFDHHLTAGKKGLNLITRKKEKIDNIPLNPLECKIYEILTPTL